MAGWARLISSKLFDLETDPKEEKDLAKEYPEIVKQMADTLESYQESGRSRRPAH